MWRFSFTACYPFVQFPSHLLVYLSRVSLCKLMHIKYIVIFLGHFGGSSWGLVGARSENLVCLSLSFSKWLLFSEDTKLYIWPWNMNQIPNLCSTLTGALRSHLTCVNGKAQALHEKRSQFHCFPGAGSVQQTVYTHFTC